MSTQTGWPEAIEGWTLTMIAADRSPGTITTRTDHLRRLARWAGERLPGTITTQDLDAWAGSHTTWSTEYRRSVRASLRGFYRWCVKAGIAAVSPAEDLASITPAQPRPRPASEDAYRKALMKARPRERLMVRLSAELGLRRAEVAVVHPERDLSRDLLGWSLCVHGKGRKDRIIPLPDDIASELRERGDGFAFPGDIDGHLSPRWVGKVVTRLLPPGVTMHQLRHRFGTVAYAATKDIRVVQELLGHASVATTQRYVAVPDEALRAAVMAVAS